MPRRILWFLFVCMSVSRLCAQDLEGIQIHGFANQGFLFTSPNNYLSMKSSSGSLNWTEGAVSVIDSLSSNLRVGMQLHMYQLGDLGGPNIQVDWASGDYKVDDHLGFRAGRTKTVLGLFNDSQDIDSLHLWILLPQSMYPIDNKSFYLAHLGGEVYGGLRLGDRVGALEYRGYAGHSNLDLTGGYLKRAADNGLIFTEPPDGKVFGGDLRWVSNLRAFTIGASAHSLAMDGSAPGGSQHIARFLTTTEYAQFEKGKFYVAGEYRRTPLFLVLTIGPTMIPIPLDQRAWYAMGSYRVSERIHFGCYYSHFVNASGDTSLPRNYSKDWDISGRWNINSYFYAKLEGHFLDGTGLGYYNSTNRGGLKPRSNMLAAKLGFSF